MRTSVYIVALCALAAARAAPAPEPEAAPAPAALPDPGADDTPEIIEIIAPANGAQVTRSTHAHAHSEHKDQEARLITRQTSSSRPAACEQESVRRRLHSHNTRTDFNLNPE